MSDAAKLDAYLAEHRDRHIAEFFDFLRIPSVSTDPEHKADVRRCAEFLVTRFAAMGFEVEAVETPGHPIVYAEWLGAPEGAPTILYYGHYDVQPPDPLDLWKSPPFEPTVRDGAVFARGAADDKGQVWAHVVALEALMKVEGALPVNLKLVIEGEEESGSTNLDAFLEGQAERLAADVVVVSDTAMFDRDVPSICYGLRGLSYQQIDVYGPNRDLHSGVYGGGVANPLNVLCQMVAKLKDEDGRVLIPGFYDAVRELDSDERAEIAKLPYDEAAFLGEIGAKPHGEPGYSTLERVGARPSLDLNGIWGGFTGVGAKTVLPAEAHAKVSMRLVPDQDPKVVDQLFADYVKSIAPDTVTVKVTAMHGGSPAIADRTSPYVQAAAQALEQVFGKEPVFVREGGSIPVVASFKKLLGVDTILAGFSLSDDRIHSPNEKFELRCFEAATRWSVRVWDLMAQRNSA